MSKSQFRRSGFIVLSDFVIRHSGFGINGSSSAAFDESAHSEFVRFIESLHDFAAVNWDQSRAK
jgi:hypothetical protein